MKHTFKTSGQCMPLSNSLYLYISNQSWIANTTLGYQYYERKKFLIPEC